MTLGVSIFDHLNGETNYRKKLTVIQAFFYLEETNDYSLLDANWKIGFEVSEALIYIACALWYIHVSIKLNVGCREVSLHYLPLRI